MNRLYHDPGLRREMGERGYHKLRERWSEDAHLESYFRLLEETARRKFGTVPWERRARQTLEFPAAWG